MKACMVAVHRPAVSEKPVPAPTPDQLETYNSSASWRPGNNFGGNAVFKALTHPLVAAKAAALQQKLQGKRVAVYDPDGHYGQFAALFPLKESRIEGYYVQNVAHRGRLSVEGLPARLITDLDASCYDVILLASFAAERVAQQAVAYVGTTPTASLGELHLDAAFLTNTKNYLDPLNFVVNNILWEHRADAYSVLSATHYWAEYGAKNTRLWLCLVKADGTVLAQGWYPLTAAAGAAWRLDSRDVAAHFGLKDDFFGTLFIHVVGTAGHDLIKYGLDFFDANPRRLTATHDANPWPAHSYAGIPAPDKNQHVIVHLQSALPVATPGGTIGLYVHGAPEKPEKPEKIVWIDQELPAFGLINISVGEVFPGVAWPQQLEVIAHKALVRPRYTVENGSQRWIGHGNVVRADLQPDAELATLEPVFGKGFILPLPILPAEQYATDILPTPMTTVQNALPLKALVFDAEGKQLLEEPLGLQKRGKIGLVSVDALLKKHNVTLKGHGTMQMIYDFSHGVAVDGWLHAIARATRRDNGHVAETSFGAHIFNSAAVYKNEPQSYTSAAPGLTTRLFLRLVPGYNGFCCLIYPVSKAWHAHSDTVFVLRGSDGAAVAEARRAIPANGSVLVTPADLFSAADLAKAGDFAHISIRDKTCRLFGYAGLRDDTNGGFNLDHMFGF